MSISEELLKVLKDEFATQTATLKEEISSLRQEIRQVGLITENRIKSCEENILKVESDVLNLKRNAIKNNIIIVGLNLDDSDLLHSVIAQLNSHLDVNLTEGVVNNIYRLDKNKSIIKVEFLTYIAKSLIISRRHRLKSTGIFINNDICEEDREDLKLLRQQLILARRKNYKAYIRSNDLYVNGEKFTIEQLRNQTDSSFSSPTTKGKNKISERIPSAPSSPSPITRYNQMLSEHEHLRTEENSKLNKEITTINQLLDKAVDLEQLGRTRSKSGGSKKHSSIRRAENFAVQVKKGD